MDKFGYTDSSIFRDVYIEEPDREESMLSEEENTSVDDDNLQSTFQAKDGRESQDKNVIFDNVGRSIFNAEGNGGQSESSSRRLYSESCNSNLQTRFPITEEIGLDRRKTQYGFDKDGHERYFSSSTTADRTRSSTEADYQKVWNDLAAESSKSCFLQTTQTSNPDGSRSQVSERVTINVEKSGEVERLRKNTKDNVGRNAVRIRTDETPVLAVPVQRNCSPTVGASKVKPSLSAGTIEMRPSSSSLSQNSVTFWSVGSTESKQDNHGVLGDCTKMDNESDMDYSSLQSLDSGKFWLAAQQSCVSDGDEALKDQIQRSVSSSESENSWDQYQKDMNSSPSKLDGANIFLVEQLHRFNIDDGFSCGESEFAACTDSESRPTVASAVMNNTSSQVTFSQIVKQNEVPSSVSFATVDQLLGLSMGDEFSCAASEGDGANCTDSESRPTVASAVMNNAPSQATCSQILKLNEVASSVSIVSEQTTMIISDVITSTLTTKNSDSDNDNSSSENDEPILSAAVAAASLTLVSSEQNLAAAATLTASLKDMQRQMSRILQSSPTAQAVPSRMLSLSSEQNLGTAVTASPKDMQRQMLGISQSSPTTQAVPSRMLSLSSEQDLGSPIAASPLPRQMSGISQSSHTSQAVQSSLSSEQELGHPKTSSPLPRQMSCISQSSPLSRMSSLSSEQNLGSPITITASPLPKQMSGISQSSPTALSRMSSLSSEQELGSPKTSSPLPRQMSCISQSSPLSRMSSLSSEQELGSPKTSSPLPRQMSCISQSSPLSRMSSLSSEQNLGSPITITASPLPKQMLGISQSSPTALSRMSSLTSEKELGSITPSPLPRQMSCISQSSPLSRMSSLSSEQELGSITASQFPRQMSAISQSSPTALSREASSVESQLSRETSCLDGQSFMAFGGIQPIQDQTQAEIEVDAATFQQTASWEDALDILFSTPHRRVVVTGMPGSGKCTLAKALLRHAQANMNIPAVVVKTFEEWRMCVGGGNLGGGSMGGGPGPDLDSRYNSPPSLSEFSESAQPQIVLLEHIFGCEMLQDAQVKEWRSVLNIMLKFCEQGKLFLVFTFYPHVLKALLAVLPDGTLFSPDCQVELGIRRNAAARKDERERILVSHLRHKVRDRTLGRMICEGEILFQPSFLLQYDESGPEFPDCCRRFADFLDLYVPPENAAEEGECVKRHVTAGMKIFSRPSPVFRDFVQRLLQSDDVKKESMITALCLLLSGVNVMEVGPDVVPSFCQRFGLSSNCSLISIQGLLGKFRGTLVTEDCGHFINRHAYEGTALALAKHLPNASLVVRVVDWPFLIRRCVVPLSGKATDDYLKQYVVEIKRISSDEKMLPGYKALASRIAHGLLSREDMLFAVQFPALKTKNFFDDVHDLLGDDGLQMAVSQTDSVYNQPLLFWSVFNFNMSFSSSFFAEFIFKTLLQLGKAPSKPDLALAALACCVFAGKFRLLETFLKYWKKATKESVLPFLQGKMPETQKLSFTLPKSEFAVSDEWKSQLKHLKHVQTDTTSRNADEESRPGAKAAKVSRSINVSQDPPLHLAVRYSNCEVVSLFAQQYSQSLLVQDCHGRTALHVAASLGHVHVAEVLLQHGDSKKLIDLVDGLGNTPLHEAAHEGHVEMTKLLVGAAPHLKRVQNGVGSMPIDLALLEGHSDIAAML